MKAKPGVFISHIHEDQRVALAIEKFVRDSLLGAIEVFNASNRQSISPGDPWRDLIIHHLRDCKTTIVLASPESVSRPWINFESGGAWTAGNRVIPCCMGIEPSALPVPLAHLQAVKLTTSVGLKDLILHLASLSQLDSPKHVDYDHAAAAFVQLERERERDDLLDLFTRSSGYDSRDALVLFKKAMKHHHISKWGVAVPVTSGAHDVLLGFHFSDSYLGAFPHFLPSYAIEAQRSMNVCVMSDRARGPFQVTTEPVWQTSTNKFFEHVRSVLLDDGLHPKGNFDPDGICERLRQTLAFRAEARSAVHDVRPNLGAVICLVGRDLALTTKGLEHVRLQTSEAIPYWAAFKRAGLKTKSNRDGLIDDDDHWFTKSGFAAHPEMDAALKVVRILYKSGFLIGLSDHYLVYEH